MEILFSILCTIFAVLASVFGVRNRINGTKLGTNGRVRDDRSRYNDIVSDHSRLKKFEERDNENIRACGDILKRIRKREPEVDNKK